MTTDVAADLEGLLRAVNPDLGEPMHTVLDRSNPVFTWDYRSSRAELAGLHRQAKAGQWDIDDLPWDVGVDQERIALAAAAIGGFGRGLDLVGTPFARWGAHQWLELGVETHNWMLSNALHVEQGALLCSAKLIEAAPWIDAKLFATSQAADEARHVEAFARYLDEHGSGHYPVNAHLGALLDDVLADARWDVTYLGMQVLVEGLALAGFELLHRIMAAVQEPLLVELLERVIADEARHQAFGVVSLGEVYRGLTAPEVRERQEFAFEAALRMRDRFLAQEVWDRLAVSPHDAALLVGQLPERRLYERALFSKVVPNCSRIGLLDAGDGWLRRAFGELGVLVFEDDVTAPATGR